MAEDKWKLKEDEGSTYNTRLQYGWTKLEEFYGRWILNIGNLNPVQLTEEFCEKHNIGVKECLEYRKDGLIFYDKEQAEKFRSGIWEKREYDKQVHEALEAWWNPEKYYSIIKK